MIHVEQIAGDDRGRAPDQTFKPREMRRLFIFLKPFRRMLFAGMLFTVVFACLHTVSISGAFPVFKILLEPEGFSGWIDRMVAGRRLSLVFAPLVEDEPLTVVHVERSSSKTSPSSNPIFDSFSDSLHPGDQLLPLQGEDIRVWLQSIALEDSQLPIKAKLNREGTNQIIELARRPVPWEMRALLRIRSIFPAEARSEKLRALVYVLVLIVLVSLVANGCRYFGEVLVSTAVLRSMMDLRALLYERTLHLPMGFFATQTTSDLVTRFVQDIQEIQRGLLTLFGKFVREPLRAVFILAWAFLLDWRITLTMVIVGPAAVCVFWQVGRHVKQANRRLLQAYGEMIGALTTSLQNLRVVKTYTAEDQERERLRGVDWSMFAHQLRLVKLNALVSPMMETIAVFAGSLAVVWLLSRVLDHQLSLSRFVTLGIALSVLFDPLRKLSDVWVRVQRSTAGAERTFQVIDHPVETGSDPNALELSPLEKALEFEGVTFTYPGAEQPALRDVTLTIRKGETVALVGPNGSGKTTLVSMLPRLFDPDRGQIRYDGTDLREAKLSSLRRQIGLVSQEAIVFAGTPTENITYGQTITDTGRLEEAARRASADEFIRNIPGAYEAKLGERGTTLSGGQRQRLAIARAIYRNAPILIFDEATSQVDSESEARIQRAVRELAQGRTTLIIAHRLSTIQFASRIVVMDAGRVIDQGTQVELLKRCALFRTLWETQLQA